MVEPIKPRQAREKRLASIPDVVIESVNHLLTEKVRNGHAKILQKDIVKEIIFRINQPSLGFSRPFTENQLYESGWLDFEPIFRRAGWKVTYDKCTYGDSTWFDAYYEFVESRELPSERD